MPLAATSPRLLRCGPLVLYFGRTGKTHLIRAVMTELSDVRRAVVCVPLLEFLSNANPLLGATSSFDRALLVFEDFGDVLSPQ